MENNNFASEQMDAPNSDNGQPLVHPMFTPLTADIIIKRVRDGAVIPTRASDMAAGYDLYAWLGKDSLTIKPHSTEIFTTGLQMQLPAGMFAGIFARSGISTKRGLRPATCTGVIDGDYRGEYMVALHNDTDEPQTINDGERIAQMVLLPYVQMNFIESEDIAPTERGSGGFGSTGL